MNEERRYEGIEFVDKNQTLEDCNQLFKSLITEMSINMHKWFILIKGSSHISSYLNTSFWNKHQIGKLMFYATSEFISINLELTRKPQKTSESFPTFMNRTYRHIRNSISSEIQICISRSQHTNRLNIHKMR